MKGAVFSMDMLITAGANVNVSDADGWTPLFYAVAASRLPAVRRLCENGAEIDHVDNRGASSLFYVSHKGVLRHLLCMRCSVNLQDHNGLGPLFSAVRGSNSADLVTLLIQAACSPHETDMFGRSPLIWSQCRQTENCTQALLEAKSTGAATHRMPDFLTNFIKDQRFDDARAELRRCLKRKSKLSQMKLLKVLFASTCSGDQSEERCRRVVQESGLHIKGLEDPLTRQSPLHQAAAVGGPKCVKYLLEAECSPNHSDISGTTPLLVAAARGCIDSLGVLLKYRGDVQTTDVNGNNVIVTAQKSGQDSVVHFLFKCFPHLGCQTHHPQQIVTFQPENQPETQPRTASITLPAKQGNTNEQVSSNGKRQKWRVVLHTPDDKRRRLVPGTKEFAAALEDLGQKFCKSRLHLRGA